MLPAPVVICGERVCQMTKVYDDIEAVTHLLEEVCTFVYTYILTLGLH